MSSNVPCINKATFMGCNSLEYVYIPDDMCFEGSEEEEQVLCLFSIADYAFYGCISIEYFYVPYCSQVERTAFNACMLSNVYYSGTEEEWAEYVNFESYYSLNEAVIHYNDDMPTGIYGSNITWSFDENGTLSFSGTGEMMSADEYYENSDGEDIPWAEIISSVKKIEIQDGITAIGEYMFWTDNYTSLTDFYIPDSVEKTGVYLRNPVPVVWSSSIKNIAVSENNERFSSLDGSLYNKKQTKLIQYASGREDKTYTTPETVTTIGQSTFYQCENLETINISKNVESIEYKPFRLNFNLVGINVDTDNDYYYSADGILYGKDRTMLICYPAAKENKEYTIPSVVLYIEPYAFECCEKLEKITIPNGIDYIDDYAFRECFGLKTVDVYGGLENFSGIGQICSNAFMNCLSLERVQIPRGISIIDSQVFRGCESLTQVSIPSSVEEIDSTVFSGCDNLTDVYYGGNEERWEMLIVDSDELLNATIHFMGGDYGAEILVFEGTSDGLKANIIIDNNTADNTNPFMVFAVYDKDKSLKFATIIERTIYDYSTEYINIVTDECDYEEGDYARVFMWEDIENGIPLVR